MKTLFATNALLADGWSQNATIEIDDAGLIRRVLADQTPTADMETVDGPLLPGMANVHSHAWQRIFAGLTEVRGDFWAWRGVMYRYAQGIGPDDLSAITAQAYAEMLQAGYTSVGEFHYLHHAPDGSPYDNPAEMSEQVIEAALAAGISITHLPVLYQYSDFGSKPPASAQKRYCFAIDAFNNLLRRLHTRYAQTPGVRIGCAPHSLRAVDANSLADVVRQVTGPIHIHIAEQPKEVADCIHWSGRRPVEWLIEHVDVDSSWCLVHATHVERSEMKAIANANAVVGICPTTEANLGDGIFPAAEFLHLGGDIAVGSDSQISIDPAEELRLLEYAQRLTTRRRGVLADDSGRSVGEFLYSRARTGGAKALGIESGTLAAGSPADLLVLNGSSPLLAGKQGHQWLDTWIFSGGRNLVKDVMTLGEWRVRDGRHVDEALISRRFAEAVQRLQAK